MESPSANQGFQRQHSLHVRLRRPRPPGQRDGLGNDARPLLFRRLASPRRACLGKLDRPIRLEPGLRRRPNPARPPHRALLGPARRQLERDRDRRHDRHGGRALRLLPLRRRRDLRRVVEHPIDERPRLEVPLPGRALRLGVLVQLP